MAEEVEESLRTLLLTFSAVTAIVGVAAAARIKPDRLHQGGTLPAIIIEVDNEEPQNDLSGVGGLVFSNVNIKCRAATKAAARALAEAVRLNGTDPGTGLAGYSGTAGDQTIGAVLESETTSFIPKEAGSDQGYYDTDAAFVISYNETV